MEFRNCGSNEDIFKLYETVRIFSYDCNFISISFNSVNRVEISIRDENLHIIIPLNC